MKDIGYLKKYLKSRIKECEKLLIERDKCDFTERLNPKYKEADNEREECYAAIRMIKKFEASGK